MSNELQQMSFVETEYAKAVKQWNVRKIVRFGNMIADRDTFFKKHGNKVRIRGNVHTIESLLQCVLDYEQGLSDPDV